MHFEQVPILFHSFGKSIIIYHTIKLINFQFMKKITLLLASLFVTLTASAQLPDGTIAPNFTATDLNGNVHTLSEYLTANKTVILYISATWCGPCWNYHSSGALNDLYSSYGPDGSDEVVILFVEGDNTTTIADLNGTGPKTLGDWVTGSKYPIIDSRAVAQQYAITYYPTVYRICSDGIIKNIGALSPTSLRASINSGCDISLEGVQNNAFALPTENGICSTNSILNARVKNLGENVITSATIDLKEDGVVVRTANYTGNINRFQTKDVPFESFNFNETSTYTTTINNINGATPFNPAEVVAEAEMVLAKLVPSEVTIKVYTDAFPKEISWNIRNSANVIVANGGPYLGLPGSVTPGGVDGNTTKVHDVTLAADDCYSIELKDLYGDGWSAGNTQHGLEVFNGDTSILLIDGEFNGKSLKKSNAITTTNYLGVADSNITKINLYPNPTTGIVQINTLETVKITVVDMLGKVVYENASVDAQTLINLSSFQKGIYVAKIIGENTTQTEKIILN